MGLGHLRRTTTIASRLVKQLPGSSVLILTGVPSGCFFELPDGVDFIKLPSVRKVAVGEYVPRSLSVSLSQLKRLRAAVIQQAVHILQPDLLLVDHTPVGLWGELLPALQSLKQRSRPAAIVLGLRDVLDAPQVTTSLWHRNGGFQAINKYYDSVLIYGAEEVFDTARQYQLSRETSTDLHYCGYICPDRSPTSGESWKQDRRPNGKPLVVLTAGGGADGYPMMASCLKAVRELGDRAHFQLLCITGPFMSRDEREALRREAVGLPVRIFWCVEDGSSYLEAAELLITMAGYNTLMEAFQLRKKLLVLPRSGPSAEQQMRSALYARRGLLRDAGTEPLTAKRLGELMIESIAAQAPTAALPGLDGVDTVVRHLCAALNLPAVTRRTQPASARH